MPRPQFSIRMLLWLMLIVGLLCAVSRPIWRYFRRPQLRYTIWSDGTSTRRQLTLEEKEKLKQRAGRSKAQAMPLGQ